MDELFDLDLPQKNYQEGYEEGIKAGRKSGLEEGYALGNEEGVKLGRELGQIAGRLYRILQDASVTLPEVSVRKLARTLIEISTFCFENIEDPEREQRVLRIRGSYKELCASLGSHILPKPSIIEPTSTKLKFDF